MPSQIIPVPKLKAAIPSMDLPCSGFVTHLGEILLTGKPHKKRPDRFLLPFCLLNYRGNHR